MHLGSWWCNQAIQPSLLTSLAVDLPPLFLKLHAMSAVSGLVLVGAEAYSIITRLDCRTSVPDQEEDLHRAYNLPCSLSNKASCAYVLLLPSTTTPSFLRQQ